MNVSLWWGMGPPDYPPVSANIANSPAPLYCPADAAQQASASLPERATLAGVLDLITGEPLVAQTDFELPFGGAVFRHTRTFTQMPSFPLFELESLPPDDPWRPWPDGGSSDQVFRENPSLPAWPEYHAAETLWDWHGTGWMMSENPLFLFDASYWGVVADGSPSESPNPGTATRCYFVPDAQRSIPFERRFADGTGNPIYVAPERFDAVMTYEGGAFDRTSDVWTTLPTVIHIWLYRGSIRYDIQIQPGNVGPRPPTDAFHHRPSGPDGAGGYGIPYWGRVVSIADRFGNHADFEYAPDVQAAASDAGPTDGCYQCTQNCAERGQIQAARLYAAGEQLPTWTLIYTYREFKVRSDPSDDHLKALRGHAVHAIRAYAGNRSLSAGHPILTLADSAFTPTSLADAFPSVNGWLERLDSVDDVQAFGLPEDWVIEARYTYADPHWEKWSEWREPWRQAFSGCIDEEEVAANYAYQPRLLKTVIKQRKVASSNVGLSETYWINRYSAVKNCLQNLLDRIILRGTMSPPRAAAVIEAIRKKGILYSGDSEPTPVLDAGVNTVLRLGRSDRVAVFDPKTGELGVTCPHFLYQVL